MEGSKESGKKHNEKEVDGKRDICEQVYTCKHSKNKNHTVTDKDQTDGRTDRWLYPVWIELS